MSRYISIILGFLLIAILLGYALASSGTPESGAETGARTAIGASGAEMPTRAAAPLSETPVRAVSSPEGAVGLASSGESAMLAGVASYVSPKYGPSYLALPGGPGIPVTICAYSGDPCVARVSTDAGPSLAMQRAGRVADLSWHDFGTLCECAPAKVGLIRVLVTYAAPRMTLPPTDWSE